MVTAVQIPLVPLPVTLNFAQVMSVPVLPGFSALTCWTVVLNDTRVAIIQVGNSAKYIPIWVIEFDGRYTYYNLPYSYNAGYNMMSSVQVLRSDLIQLQLANGIVLTAFVPQLFANNTIPYTEYVTGAFNYPCNLAEYQKNTGALSVSGFYDPVQRLTLLGFKTPAGQENTNAYSAVYDDAGNMLVGGGYVNYQSGNDPYNPTGISNLGWIQANGATYTLYPFNGVTPFILGFSYSTIQVNINSAWFPGCNAGNGVPAYVTPRNAGYFSCPSMGTDLRNFLFQGSSNVAGVYAASYYNSGNKILGFTPYGAFTVLTTVPIINNGIGITNKYVFAVTTDSPRKVMVAVNTVKQFQEQPQLIGARMVYYVYNQTRPISIKGVFVT